MITKLLTSIAFNANSDRLTRRERGRRPRGRIWRGGRDACADINTAAINYNKTTTDANTCDANSERRMIENSGQAAEGEDLAGWGWLVGEFDALLALGHCPLPDEVHRHDDDDDDDDGGGGTCERGSHVREGTWGSRARGVSRSRVREVARSRERERSREFDCPRPEQVHTHHADADVTCERDGHVDVT
eukprot:2718349-Rhodomonas_salina.1